MIKSIINMLELIKKLLSYKVPAKAKGRRAVPLSKKPGAKDNKKPIHSKKLVTERIVLPNGKTRIIFTKSPRDFEPRIAGVNLPLLLSVEASLCKIFGIGISRARNIVKAASLDSRTRASQISPRQLRNVRAAGKASGYKVESTLKRFERRNIQRMRRVGTSKGRRHRVLLPVRGQRTKCNARTRKEQRL